MHKSWGNAIDFDEAAERMGVDVMRWMFVNARPEDNIRFGWHAADEARRELLVLWNVYAFFVTYARLAGWTPALGRAADRAIGRPSTAGSCPGRPRRRPIAGERLDDYDALRAATGRSRRSSTTSRPGTCDGPAAARRATRTHPTGQPRSRRSMRRSSRPPGCWLRSCRSCPRRCTATSSRRSMTRRADSVHLTQLADR